MLYPVNVPPLDRPSWRRATISCGLLLCAALIACTETTRTQAPPAQARVSDDTPPRTDLPPTIPATGSRLPDAASDERFACEHDGDCIASCRHGAVNRTWHTAAYPGEEACEGGCTSKGADLPRCEARSCAAYLDGSPDPGCTHRDEAVLAGPGPAHRCATDDDCMQTCAHGAINREWFGWQTPEPDCRGGCTRAGTETPLCEDGRCVAYHLGKRDDLCTERPVPRP
jgi:hypothetical protein